VVGGGPEAGDENPPDTNPPISNPGDGGPEEILGDDNPGQGHGDDDDNQPGQGNGHGGDDDDHPGQGQDDIREKHLNCNGSIFPNGQVIAKNQEEFSLTVNSRQAIKLVGNNNVLHLNIVGSTDPFLEEICLVVDGNLNTIEASVNVDINLFVYIGHGNESKVNVRVAQGFSIEKVVGIGSGNKDILRVIGVVPLACVSVRNRGNGPEVHCGPTEDTLELIDTDKCTGKNDCEAREGATPIGGGAESEAHPGQGIGLDKDIDHPGQGLGLDKVGGEHPVQSTGQGQGNEPNQ